MDAKSTILARARDVISRSRTRPMGPIPRNYIHSGENPPGSKPAVDEMIERLEDYSAEIVVTPRDAAILDTIGELLGEARSVIVPVGLPEDCKEAAVRGGRAVVEDSHGETITTLDLNEIDAMLTCSHVGISVSGTIVLDGGPDQGRWTISLVPDRRVVVLGHEIVMPTVPQAIGVLGEHPTRSITWIAGGSTTSDIKLMHVNGVHGLRNLHVVIAH